MKDNHSVFREQEPASIQQVIDACQISGAELNDLLEKKALEYQIMQTDDSKYAFVETENLMELVDQVLVFLNAEEAVDQISTQGILS